jgi:DNA mismatch repair ATPase MutS
MYQSISSSIKFYKNFSKINDDLNIFKKFIHKSTLQMENFVLLNKNKPSYNKFCQEVTKHASVLQQMTNELANVNSSKIIYNINNLGYLLKCYYSLHSNEEYEESIRYMIGFEGYLNNLQGIYENIQNKHINNAKFSKKNCIVKNQYYPPFINNSHVKNSCNLNNNMIITGVNASGKTTVLKTTIINIIFSQQFGCGFYQSFSLNPYTHIHSYLNIPDTSGRDSLFQAETRRCKEIIDIINEKDENRHFCIFDELYSGTNPIEASKCACALLLYLSKYKNVNFMLTTHYISICKKIKMKSFTGKTPIKNYKMLISQHLDGSIKYDYKMEPGICKIEGAVNVLKQMNYPSEIIHYVQQQHVVC